MSVLRRLPMITEAILLSAGHTPSSQGR